MTENAYLLCDQSREVVRQTIRDHVEHRRWELLACNVRTNHVHVVVSARLDPESVMGQLKAWSSRRLREAGLLAGRTKLWTPHGSTKYLWEIQDTREAVHYVQNLQ